MKRLALILGDQLFDDGHEGLSPNADTLFFMAEDYGLCTHYQYHKHKLVLFLAAMRSHADALRDNGLEIVYHQLTEENKEQTYEEKLKATLKDYSDIETVVTYTIEDHFFRDRIRKFCESENLTLEQCENPSFLTPTAVFEDYLDGVKKPFMHTFYQQQRKRLLILVDGDGKPLNGKWSFDEDNRKKLPKKIDVPSLPESEATKHTEAVKELVAELFKEHPGDTANFCWATTREQVEHLLERFLEERFSNFGPYEDAFESDRQFLFHTVLSPYINMGLITAREVVEAVLKFADEQDIHYPSVEGLVRQLIGWREFIRGIYHSHHDALHGNFWNHQGKLTDAWYEGTTGVTPLDDSIKKAQRYGYTHHIERLMVIGNMMLLAEIHPDQVNRWFMELYVDSADWVMVPNVYGMSQFADGGIFATKPYICGANYWSKMSSYSKKADWAPTVDGLYWRFIDQKRAFFTSNPRMSMMVSMYDKKSDEAKENLAKAAQKFIDQFTA